MEGVAVFVCNFPYDSSCLPCGFASETANGGWSTVYCTGGMIEGNQLKLIHPFSRLQLCEVEIYGRDISSNFELILYSFIQSQAQSRY